MPKKKFELTTDNYHSSEANLKYLDCSTYKNFCGTYGKSGCESRALAIAKGEYNPPKSDALLVGGYVDAYFDHSLAKFCSENMVDIFTQASIKKFNSSGKADDLQKLSQFKQADAMIERALKEPLFMKYVEGETQKIMIAEIDGVPIRVKLDSYDGHRITDLKTASSISETYYAADLGQRLNFIEYFGYVEQAYFYQTAVEQNTGKKLPFYLAVITKDKFCNEPHPRVAVIQIPDSVIEDKGREIKNKIHTVWSILQGEIDPVACKHCEYCADTLPCELFSMDELLLGV